MWEWLRDDDDILDSMLHIIGVAAGVLSGARMGVHSMPIQGVVSKVFAVLKGHSTWTTRIQRLNVSSRLRGVVEEDIGVVRRLIFDVVIKRGIGLVVSLLI